METKKGAWKIRAWIANEHTLGIASLNIIQIQPSLHTRDEYGTPLAD